MRGGVCVCVFVCQNYCSHRQGGAHRDGTTNEYFWRRLEHTVVPNVQRLQAACRKFRVEVIFTVSFRGHLHGFRALRPLSSDTNLLPRGCCHHATAEAARDAAQVIESLTADGRDRSLDYKISGFHVPRGSWDARVLDAIAPTADEIVLPKTSSSAFVSTTLDTVLRNLGVKVSPPSPGSQTRVAG